MEKNGRGRARTALVVDDDPRWRALVEVTLREVGFEVLSVGDGYRATAVIARARQELELLVVDTEMPGMHGWAVIRYAKAKHRKVRVLRLGGRTTRRQALSTPRFAACQLCLSRSRPPNCSTHQESPDASVTLTPSAVRGEGAEGWHGPLHSVQGDK